MSHDQTGRHSIPSFKDHAMLLPAPLLQQPKALDKHNCNVVASAPYPVVNAMPSVKPLQPLVSLILVDSVFRASRKTVRPFSKDSPVLIPV